jgi:hypothetical protein
VRQTSLHVGLLIPQTVSGQRPTKNPKATLGQAQSESPERARPHVASIFPCLKRIGRLSFNVLRIEKAAPAHDAGSSLGDRALARIRNGFASSRCLGYPLRSDGSRLAALGARRLGQAARICSIAGRAFRGGRGVFCGRAIGNALG